VSNETADMLAMHQFNAEFKVQTADCSTPPDALTGTDGPSPDDGETAATPMPSPPSYWRIEHLFLRWFDSGRGAVRPHPAPDRSGPVTGKRAAAHVEVAAGPE
jgi:hypothetical protein